MKGLIVTQDYRLTLGDVPKPEPGPYEALVKIRACGICGTTDREIIKGTQPYQKDYPCLLGHEAVGEVIAIGAKVRSFKLGDLVTRPSGHSPAARQAGIYSGWGGFAEFGLVGDRQARVADGDAAAAGDYNLLRQNVVPPGTNVADAVLAISLAETASWFQHLPAPGGQAVCVAGTGIAGLSLAFWAKLAGASPVIVLGRRDERLDLARSLGADHGINVMREEPGPAVKKLTRGRGASFFYEAVGARDQIRVGLSTLAPRGLLAIYGAAPGLKYDLEWGWGPGWATITIPSADEHLAYAWVLDLMRRGLVPRDRLLTHRWPLDQWQQAFADVDAGRVIKGMLEMP